MEPNLCPCLKIAFSFPIECSDQTSSCLRPQLKLSNTFVKIHILASTALTKACLFFSQQKQKIEKSRKNSNFVDPTIIEKPCSWYLGDASRNLILLATFSHWVGWSFMHWAPCYSISGCKQFKMHPIVEMWYVPLQQMALRGYVGAAITKLNLAKCRDGLFKREERQFWNRRRWLWAYLDDTYCDE